MDCAQAREALQADLDRELDAIAATELQRHRAICAECQRAYAAQEALRAALRRDAQYHRAPAALAARIAAATRQDGAGFRRAGRQR